MTKRMLAQARVAGIFVAALSLVVFFPAGPASAEDSVAYERTSYDGRIWSVTSSGAYPLSYEEWSGLGYPAYSQANTEYVKAAPFLTVYAVTWFELAQSELMEAINYSQFVAAGSPGPTIVPWIDGIEVHRWSTGPELFATDAAGLTVKLSYAQWSAASYPSFVSRENRGFVSMTWDSSGAIAYMCDVAAGRGGRLTYEQWVALGSPTPSRLTRTPADFLYQVAGSASPTIYYSGPIVRRYAPGQITSEAPARALTYPEWRAMGSPPPLVTNITYPENWYCSNSDPPPFS
ncbi:hypothetical protein V6S02_03045 [Microbacterium sp. CCNWLW134]|uniref:hypothetical protein n=1 Tax=Microbacterium sp. CCNWLW134 TaxID=3122064 RepID=UPI00301015CC